jgi:myo-inositol-1(or 4)-monophosphatase
MTVPTGPALHPALEAAAEAAKRAHAEAADTLSPSERAEKVADGADGTPTMRIDALVETAILEAVEPHSVNVLSEEAGFIDVGSTVTLVLDPLDGSANAAAGVPLSCYVGAVAVDGVFTEALTVWLETGQRWAARVGEPVPYRTSGRTKLDGAAVSMLRPHPHNPDTGPAWWRVAERAARVRILSCSALEACLVAQGSIDAFADARSDTHRLVDLAAALVMLPPAGGVVADALGRPLEFDTDLTHRWSGIVAATPQLAEQLQETLRGQ